MTELTNQQIAELLEKVLAALHQNSSDIDDLTNAVKRLTTVMEEVPLRRG